MSRWYGYQIASFRPEMSNLSLWRSQRPPVGKSLPVLTYSVRIGFRGRCVTVRVASHRPSAISRYCVRHNLIFWGVKGLPIVVMASMSLNDGPLSATRIAWRCLRSSPRWIDHENPALTVVSIDPSLSYRIDAGDESTSSTNQTKQSGAGEEKPRKWNLTCKDGVAQS